MRWCKIIKNLKIIIIGDGAVGKTSILKRYMLNKFHESQMITVGVDYTVLTIKVDKNKYTLNFWDLCGARYPNNKVLNTILKKSSGCVLVYDIARRETFNNLILWNNEINKIINNIEQISFIVVGNKIDLSDDKPIDAESIDNILKTLNIGIHLFTSAKTGYNIEEVFTELIHSIMKNNK